MKFASFFASAGAKLGSACLVGSVLLGLSSEAKATTGIIMPIFGNTSSQFNAALSAAQKVKMVAIINPDGGPGSSRVGGITAWVSKLRANGAITVGYIPTGAGSQPLSSVRTQMDRYVAWYGVNGIFLDEMSDQNSKLSYYRSLYNYAKSKGLFVVGNPGTFVPGGYGGVADLLVTYEDPMANGWKKQRPSSWTTGYPATKIGAIVYGASSSAKKSVIDRAVALKYGWIYATDGSGNDPFQRASTYLSSEADYIRALNGGKK